MNKPHFTISDTQIDGDLNQNVFGNTVGRDMFLKQYNFTRRQPAMYLGPSEISQRVECYEPVHNHSKIVQDLHLNGAVILTGPPGSGRETTAIVAIRQLCPDIPIRRFDLDNEDIEEIRHADSCGYLIKAGNLDPGLLSSCADAVRDSGSLLAVMTEGRESGLVTYKIPLIPVEAPSAVAVYRRWAAIGHRLPEWPDWKQAASLLDGARPADGRRLADLAADASPIGGDISERQEEVASAYRGWEAELRDWFGKRPESLERALLIAAATLPSGADDRYVYEAAGSLARELGIEVNGGGLGWRPVSELGELLEGDHEDGRVVFRRLGFAQSVLRHAFADYPLAHAQLLGWLSLLPTGTADAFNSANEAAETFTDIAADLNEIGQITKKAYKWGEDNLADLAFTALSRTCMHPRVGGKVRAQLYDWSRQPGTPQTLKLIIAQVCELLGETYTSVALTRLKHLATNGNARVRDEVIKTALTLADGGHRREVMAAALSWCEEADQGNLSYSARQRRRKTGASVFIRLASRPASSGLAEILAESAALDVGSFKPGWRAVFEFVSDYGAAVRLWLDTALRDDSVRAPVCAVFVAAPERARESAETIIGIAERWAAEDRGDPARSGIAEHIVVALARPWWRRLAKMVVWGLRRRFPAAFWGRWSL